MLLRNSVTQGTRIVVGILEVTFWVTLVVCLSVCSVSHHKRICKKKSPPSRAAMVDPERNLACDASSTRPRHRETWPHSKHSQQPRRRERHTARCRKGRRGTRRDNLSCSVHQWPSDGESWRDRAGRGRGGMAEPISHTARLGIGCELVSGDVNIRETLPKGGPVRTLARYRMGTPDPALPEDAQNINKLAHNRRKVLLHRKGIEHEGLAPPTNNERKMQSQLEHRRKKAEGKYIKWKTRLTTMKLTLRNRWQSGVLEKTMKSTRPANERCNMCGFFFA